MAGILADSHKGIRNARGEGFTLLELLVCVGIIAVLIGLTVPSLRGVHERALDTNDLANIRTSAQDMLAWAGDHDDVWPNGGGTAFPYLTTVTVNGETLAVFDYYEHAGGWVHVLRAHFGDYSPAWGTSRGYPASFFYSNSMISDPRLWDGCPTDPDHRWQFARQVRTTETAFPSVKGLLVTGASLNRAGEELPYSIAMTDCSAARFAVEDVTRGAYWEFCNSRLVGARPPVVHTVHGVLGRDARR